MEEVNRLLIKAQKGGADGGRGGRGVCDGEGEEGGGAAAALRGITSSNRKVKRLFGFECVVQENLKSSSSNHAAAAAAARIRTPTERRRPGQREKETTTADECA